MLDDARQIKEENQTEPATKEDGPKMHQMRKISIGRCCCSFSSPASKKEIAVSPRRRRRKRTMHTQRGRRSLVQPSRQREADYGDDNPLRRRWGAREEVDNSRTLSLWKRTQRRDSSKPETIRRLAPFYFAGRIRSVVGAHLHHSIFVLSITRLQGRRVRRGPYFNCVNKTL